jgi:hypothetical protein
MALFEKLDYSCFVSAYDGEPPEPAFVSLEEVDDAPDCVVAWINNDLPGKKQDAYAQLFSAAPEMLEALEYMTICPFDPKTAHQKINAALKKAGQLDRIMAKVKAKG